MNLWTRSALALGVGLSTASANALELADLSQAVSESSVKLKFRYRYEYVDIEGFDKEAGASTLLSRLSWTSGNLGNWHAGVDADYVAVLGAERYNSTANGRTQYPVVADPEGFDLNQAFLRYEDDGFTGTIGRQRILHPDQRFIGGVAWRQNEQTYDSVRAEFKAGAKLSVDYAYVWNVNRIFGPEDGAQPAEWRSNSHFLLSKLTLADKHKLEGFAYVLDFENGNGLPNSTATYGVSYRGKLGPVQVDATLATQSDYADSPLSYDAEFISVAAAVKLTDGLTAKANYDVLGSDDGVAAFRTPLATLHKFQGWADLFLVTPAAGIEDTNAGLAGTLGGVRWAATYHQFRSDEGAIDYGDELNFIANYKITDGVKTQFKFANYRADDFGTDTTRAWLSLIVDL